MAATARPSSTPTSWSRRARRCSPRRAAATTRSASPASGTACSCSTSATGPLTPVLLWQDRRAAAQAEELRARLDPAAVHERTGCFLHPSFWPAKLAWLREQGTLDERAAGRLVRRLPLPAADRRAADDALDRLRLRPARPARAGVGRRAARRARTGRAAAAADLRRGRRHDLPAARRRGLLEPRRRLHDAGPRRADDRHLGRLPRPARGRARAAARALLLLRRRAPAWSRAARSPTAATSTRGSSGRCASRQLEPREPDAHGLTFLPLLGGERSPAGTRSATGAIAGLTFDADAERPAAGRARRRGLPDRRDRRRASRGARGRRDRARAARERVVDPGVRRRARPAGDRLGRAGGLGARRRRSRARAARRRAGACAARPSATSPTRERTEIYAAARERQRELYRRLL